jgi:hypothetical protein
MIVRYSISLVNIKLKNVIKAGANWIFGVRKSVRKTFQNLPKYRIYGKSAKIKNSYFNNL